MMKTLSIPHFPLYGQSLIEASAGTGKTFTITGLYNRLILGHGRSGAAADTLDSSAADGSSGRLGCDQILVVTFTRAATEELRGRIRQRLRLTLEDLLRLENDQPAADSDLPDYLAQLSAAAGVSEADIRQQLLPWLQSNLALMDEAAIYTIHGFCQRMLKQFAFDSGVVFDAELVLDSEQYLQQACEDVWRTEAYGLNTEQGRFLLSRYNGPDALFAKVRSRISRPDMRIVPEINDHNLDAVWQRTKEQFHKVATLCKATAAEDIAALIQDSGLNKRSYSKTNTPKWIGQAYQYFLSSFSLPAADNLDRLTPAGMEEKLASGDLPKHELFDAIADFCAQADALQLMLEMAWLDVIKERYFDLLEKAGALTPDDLLRLLVTALRGEQGDLLASHIRRQYPLAMIDEFQDTDPQQYDIFNRIYPPAGQADDMPATEPDHHGLIMIGDPKQAIYGFRGADIFTYIQARRQLSDERRFTLGTNWRSHSLLVDGVNQLFAAHKSPFIFDEDIHFVEVAAAGKADSQPLTITGEVQSPLQLWFDGEEYSRTGAQAEVAAQCAAAIHGLLSGDAQLGDDKVQAKDIAVLVRSRKQAGWIRDALMVHGIGSVFLTRDSVYESQEAKDMFAWLQAVAHPSDERALRTALATRSQGFSALQLDHLLNNEQAWEQALEQNLAYHQLWNRRGIMAAVMHWLEQDQRAERLRYQEDGERQLTNMMHLGELLQAASRRLRGHEALLRWFGEQVFSEERSGDEAQLRLESDANLVTIVTIHKSKGLEYPLVFLPFLWDDSYLPNSKSDTQYFSVRDDCMVLDLDPDEEAKAAARRDALAESLRLLYVAVTRAVQGCFIWLADALDGRSTKQKKSRIADTALGYLLDIESDPQWSVLEQRMTDSQAIQLCAPPAWLLAEGKLSGAGEAAQIKPAQIKAGKWDHWRVSSYSQLAAAHGAHNQNGMTAAAEQSTAVSEGIADDALLRTDETLYSDSVGSFLPIAALPDDTQASSAMAEQQEFNSDAAALTFARGANAGTCLHAVFEHWDFHDQAQLLEICERELRHYGLYDEVLNQNGQTQATQPPHAINQTEQLAQWLTAVVQSPLNTLSVAGSSETFTLQDIAEGGRLDEMEFYLPVAGLQASQVNRLLAQENADSAQAERFQFDALSGYLKGFIDLIFCYQGRYYVADYKSNFLGERLQDYAPAALNAAMVSHQYDLQAWIYTVALDRLLSQRLPDYSPQQHLGGVYYFYLRGMHLGADAPLLSAVPSAATVREQETNQQATNKTTNKTTPQTESAQADLFAQVDLFDEPEVTDIKSDAASLPQAPGVYYHSVDPHALAQWRAILSGAEEDAA